MAASFGTRLVQKLGIKPPHLAEFVVHSRPSMRDDVTPQGPMSSTATRASSRPLSIAVVCNDTRGGVQPYVALALGLRRAGHAVRAVAPSDLAAMFSMVGIACAPLSGSLEATLRASDGAAERGALASMRLAARELPAHIGSWMRETLAACEGVDVVTGGVGGLIIGGAVAEKLRVPFVETHLQPLDVPTDLYPGPLFASVPRVLGGWGVRMSHRLSSAAVWMPFKRAAASARASALGLRGAAQTFGPKRALYGFSPRVVPMPDDPKGLRHVTGYWFLPASADWRPPEGLESFLARPGPVVSVGFGSMTGGDASALSVLAVDAARAVGARVILLSGWGGVDAAHAPAHNDDVFGIDAVPHDWLFPRVSAIVHHGGAGTTGAGLRSGTPSIVVPFTMDQPFWGGRVAALGVGPAPIARKRLTSERLASALSAALGDSAMRERAASLGTAIRAEDGVGAAVAHFDAWASELRAR